MNKCLFMLMSTMLIVASACSDSSDPDVPGNEDSPGTKIKVGDYYSQGLVKGIVFNVDETGEHGMVVSLDEKELKWSTLGTSVISGAVYVSMDYGKDNVSGIKSLFDDWAESFPAVAWCSSKNPGSLNTWYLPAANELRTLLDEYAGNPGLALSMEQRSGTPVNPGISYWSSTDAGGQIAYSYRYRENMSPEEELYALLSKVESHPCRCICRF
ncbi:MAG: hypothetical protein ACI3ZO_02515 [Candidatus Cryptobacteroides sp.]